MAYTSTSPVSSSPWYGPGSSPIISPSRWQTQMLDNLCVLALHNHAASAGEGASSFSSSVIFATGEIANIYPFFPSASTNWSDRIDSAWMSNGNVSTSTNGASITYNVYWGVGVHTVWFYYGKGSSFGIITGCATGASTLSNPSSIDGYVAGAEQIPSSITSVASFQFRVYTTEEFAASGCTVTGSLVGSGKYQLKFKVSGSNVGSTGYIARLGRINAN